MQFLYQDGDDFHFMNTENYEQITTSSRNSIEEDAVGFDANLEVEVEFYETTPLNVRLPKTVALKVTRYYSGSEDGRRDQYAQAATLETGVDPSRRRISSSVYDHDSYTENWVPVTLEEGAAADS